MSSSKKTKKSLKKILNTVLLGIFFICFLFLYISSKEVKRYPLFIGSHSLAVEVVRSPLGLYKGLGGRESLGIGEGMLFIFPDVARHGIVMREMLFPIDIIWLHEGRVIDMAQNVAHQPGATEEGLISYLPRKEVDMVLELPAGAVKQYNISIGDVVTTGF